jgi:hypothetical protein
MRHLPLLALGATLLVATACHRSREDDTFTLRGVAAPGHSVKIRNMNGPIRVVASEGNEVEVTAVRSYNGFLPQRVRFLSATTDDAIVVCAVWGRRGECTADDYRSQSNAWDRLFGLRGNVDVRFTVAVPRGVLVDVSTTNGSLRVGGVEAPVTAATVNGSIHVATGTGPVNATTVNGSIVASVDELRGDEPMELTTVNGSVTAELPERLDATLEMGTVNGKVESDYPLTVQGTASPKQLRGTVGDGGRRIKLTTVNGQVEVRRRA